MMLSARRVRFIDFVLCVLLLLLAGSPARAQTAGRQAGERDGKLRLAFTNDRELRVVEVDGRGERKVATVGDPLVPVVGWDSIWDQAWSPHGNHIAYGRATGALSTAQRGELRVARADGSEDKLLLTLPGRVVETVRWSPDGGRLAFVVLTPTPTAALTWGFGPHRMDVYVINADGTELRPVAPLHAWQARELEFSPDGTQLAFTADPHGLPAIYTVGIDDRSLPTRISPLHVLASDPSWSADGKRLAFSGTPLDAVDSLWAPYLWTVNANGSNARRLPVETWGTVSWSPDSRRIVYTSLRGIETIRADGRRNRLLTSAEGYEPAWSSTGKIAFIRDMGSPEHLCCPRGLSVMNADGSGLHQVSKAMEVSSFSWSR